LNICKEWIESNSAEKCEQVYLRAHSAGHMLKQFKESDRLLKNAGNSPEAKIALGMRLMAGRTEWNKGVELYGSRKAMYESYIPKSLKFVSNYRDIASSYQLNVILEQGLGDCIMMIPYILRLSTEYAVPVKVISLDGRHDAFIDDIMSSYEDVVNFEKVAYGDLSRLGGEFCWMFDLLDTVNRPVKNSGYIQVNQQIKDLAYWSKGMIGVCWRGNPAHNNDRFRSMNILELGPILDMPNVISLQCDLTDEEKDVLMDHGIKAWDKKGLVSLAAVVSNLKAVVTVDTAMSHMAGALGTNCITMLPTNADWRWGDFYSMDHKSDFYGDNHLLARQSKCGQWGDVVEYVKGELKNV
jgi:Glycosyltransferase family 9 (heptosyltransferase)